MTQEEENSQPRTSSELTKLTFRISLLVEADMTDVDKSEFLVGTAGAGDLPWNRAQKLPLQVSPSFHKSMYKGTHGASHTTNLVKRA